MGIEDCDKVFKAYDVRGIYGDGVDEDLAWAIGSAASQFLHSQLNGSQRGQSAINCVVVGHDMRPSSESLNKALVEGISSSGATCSHGCRCICRSDVRSHETHQIVARHSMWRDVAPSISAPNCHA